MHLGLLTPRYGEEVLGGTEHWLRTLCEHMVAGPGWSVEVFTTCAVSAATWADHYPPGTTKLNGVTVHRHASRSGRDPGYLALLERLRRDPGGFSPAEAMHYVELVGPVCPSAVDHAVDSACDLVAVTPYLYWPAVTGVPRLGRRVLFHGAAHDEPELHLALMSAVFSAVGGFAFNTFSERRLVETTFGVGHLPSSVVGNAVDEHKGDPAAARRALGLEPGEEFVLCLGRVERSKGSAALMDLWELYRRRRDAPRLVLVGPVQDRLSAPDGVVLAGAQPEEVKWGALAACRLLIAPSAQESFSLVVLEAWLAGRPVVVNARCGPTVEHCARSGGGVWFHDYADLESCLDRLLADAPLCSRLAANGASYARAAFSWERVVERYEELAGRVAARRGRTQRSGR